MVEWIGTYTPARYVPMQVVVGMVGFKVIWDL